MQRALLICGLVRAPEHFAAYLDGVFRLACPDLRVILSTWTGELDKYPQLRPLLSQLGVHVVEQDPPDLRLPGHMLHQVLTLELGLSLLEDDVFVLKTRPDICDLMDVAHFMQLNPQRLRPPRLPCPFTHRVHVVGLFGAHPGYINDIIFAGMAGDLRRMTLLPMVFGLKYPRMSPEQWLWSSVFLPGNAALDAFLSVNPGLVFNDPSRQVALNAALARSPLFARAMAANAVLVQDSLGYLHPDPHRLAISAACADHTLDDLLWLPLQLTGIDHHPLAATNNFVSAGIMEAIYVGGHRPSPLGNAVAEAIRAVGRTQVSRAQLAREASALAEDLQSQAGIGDHQVPAVSPSLSRVRRGPSPWQKLAEPSSGTAALESEINQMRRTIDQLTSRLARRD